jgi:hypothetical protein
MFPIFGDTIDLKKLVVIVQAGDSLMRHDAVDFLRNRLPTWDGVWSQSCLPRPDRGDSLTAKFAKISRCITLLERRSHIDDIRLRLHRIFQYQLHLRCKKEVDSSGGKNSPGQRSASVAVDYLVDHLYEQSATHTDEVKERRRRKLLNQIRAGRRLHILCSGFGYGVLLLGSQMAVNRV